jgi:hypothetical protein
MNPPEAPVRSGRFHLSERERWTVSSLIQIWRLRLLGRLLLPWHDLFTNSWIGGGVAAPIAFPLGLWWQLASRERRRRTRLDLVLALGILACIVAPISSLNAMRSERAFQARLCEFRALSADSIKRITCCDKYGREELLTTEDPEVLGAFARTCRDAKGYSPNHPHYRESWYVVVEGDETLELMCHFQQGHDEELVGYFVRKRGDSTSHRGSFISTDLRPWFELHVDRPLAAEAGE